MPVYDWHKPDLYKSTFLCDRLAVSVRFSWIQSGDWQGSRYDSIDSCHVNLNVVQPPLSIVTVHGNTVVALPVRLPGIAVPLLQTTTCRKSFARLMWPLDKWFSNCCPCESVKTFVDAMQAGRARPWTLYLALLVILLVTGNIGGGWRQQGR